MVFSPWADRSLQLVLAAAILSGTHRLQSQLKRSSGTWTRAKDGSMVPAASIAPSAAQGQRLRHAHVQMELPSSLARMQAHACAWMLCVGTCGPGMRSRLSRLQRPSGGSVTHCLIA